MARSTVSRGTYVQRRQTFRWPQTQFNAFMILILVTAGVLIGIFGEFVQIQNQMGLGIPWLFPYGITVGSLTVLLIIILLVFSNNGTLTPPILMVFSFVLGVLYITGLVDTGIQLFGPASVSGNCNTYVSGNKITGSSVYTLAWLQQNNICSCWYAVFSFWIIGTIIYIWMFIFAMQVNSGAFD
ncbi:hypothetical protein BT63DRAFT_457686 [Microthyrium microscopicum]|uniref:MARVEL domain-containing protein n=1 Tax=Microthyrium microscopicum TaxID=703497 RepID=A0A6A6U4A2_9PEZI|nr:hypothetical protein BT63DRAFT_457686 [Microthyrium microscopicum]